VVQDTPTRSRGRGGLGRIAILLLVLNEIRGLAVVASVAWAWVNRGG
jgi:hypothetical protein